jgi:hypothetical protein
VSRRSRAWSERQGRRQQGESSTGCCRATTHFAYDLRLGIPCRLRADVYPSVVDKCFGSARASLKLKAIELGLLWVEVENSGEGLIVRSFLLASCGRSFLR